MITKIRKHYSTLSPESVRGFWAGLFVTFVLLSFTTVLIPEIRDSTNLEDFLANGVTLYLSFFTTISTLYFWRNRFRIGGWILILSVLIVFSAVSFFVGGVGFIAAIFSFSVASFVSGQTLRKGDVVKANILAAFLASAMIMVDLLWPGERIEIDSQDIRAATIAVSVVLLIYLIVVLRQYPKYSLRAKFVVAILITIILLGGVIIVSDTISNRANFALIEQQNFENYHQIFLARLDNLEEFAVGLATGVAKNPEVQSAFAIGDRDKLISLTLPAYTQLDRDFDIPQHEFHTPPATSFLRVHNLNSFGDDLSSYRFTVLEANQTQATVSGPEIGRAGLGIRGVVPVFLKDEFIGTVEFGMNVDRTLLLNLKEQYGVDFQLLLNREAAGVATYTGAASVIPGPIDYLLLQTSTMREPIFAEPEVYRNALIGKISSTYITAQGLDYAIYSVPLKDYSDQIIGVLDIVYDRSLLVTQQENKTATTVGTILIGLGLAGGLLGWVTTIVLQPVEDLTNVANAISEGDLSLSASVRGGDELATLSVAFNRMTVQLRAFIDTLEQRVMDRTRAVELTADISRRLSTILDADELVSEVVELLQTAFDYYHVHIYLVDEKSGDLLLAGGTGEAGRLLLASGHRISKGKGLVGQAIETGVVVIVPDTRQDVNWLPNPLLPDTKTEVAVPIIFGESVMGALDVQHNVVGGLSQQDVDLLQAVAGQVAIALRNARQYKKAQRRAEHELQASEIVQQIQNTYTIEEALQVAVREVGRVLQASRTLAKIKISEDGNGSFNEE